MSYPLDQEKWKRVRNIMAAHDLDALVVRAPDNILYLTDYWTMKGYDMWQAIILSFLGGVMGGNAFPHFVRGITKRRYPTRLGNGPVTNVVAGWAGLVEEAAGWLHAIRTRSSKRQLPVLPRIVFCPLSKSPGSSSSRCGLRSISRQPDRLLNLASASARSTVT